MVPASKKAELGTEEALGCGRNILLAREVEGFEELRKEQSSQSGPSQSAPAFPAWRRSPFFSVQFCFLVPKWSIFDKLSCGFT